MQTIYALRVILASVTVKEPATKVSYVLHTCSRLYIYVCRSTYKHLSYPIYAVSHPVCVLSEAEERAPNANALSFSFSGLFPVCSCLWASSATSATSASIRAQNGPFGCVHIGRSSTKSYLVLYWSRCLPFRMSLVVHYNNVSDT